MNTLKVTIGVACIVMSSLANASTYTANVVIEDIYWQNQNEWWSDWHVDLYRDGVLQTPSSAEDVPKLVDAGGS